MGFFHVLKLYKWYQIVQSITYDNILLKNIPYFLQEAPLVLIYFQSFNGRYLLQGDALKRKALSKSVEFFTWNFRT